MFAKPWLILSIILIVTFFSYVNSLNNDFIRWDDDKQITENSYVKNFTKESVFYNFSEERFTFIPLTIYSILYAVIGLNPFYFHLLSLIFHLLNVVLAFILVRRITNEIVIAIFTALLFALHPMRVESVAWISELKDLLFTFFSLSAFLLYVKYLKNGLKPKYLVFVILLSILASFSKIQGLLIAPSLILMDLLYSRKITIYSLGEKVLVFTFSFFLFKLFRWYFVIIIPGIIFIFFKIKPWLSSLSKKQNILIIVSSLILLFIVMTTYMFMFPDLWSENPDRRNLFTIIERFFLAGYAIAFYLITVAYPFQLNAVHPYPQRDIAGSLPMEYYLSIIMIIVVVVISIYFILKRNKIDRIVFFGWLFFLVNISIVLHFIPIEGRLVVADRYSYLANFGLFILISKGIHILYLKYNKIKRLIIASFFVMMILFSFATYQRTFVWKNTLSLFEDVLKKNPKVSFAYINIGGEYLSERKPERALECFNLSISIDSTDATAYFNRALGHFMKGNVDSALIDFNKVIALSRSESDIALVYSNMGEIYQKTGNDSLAIIHYQKSILMDSTIASAYNNRGMYYFNNQDYSNAFMDFDKAVKLDPDYPDAWNNRGWVLTMKGNVTEAMENYNRSIGLNPEYAMAYNNRGYLKFKQNDFQGSINDYNKAIDLDSNLTEAFLNRGWVYSTAGNFKMAVLDFSVVLKRINNHQVALTNRAFAWFYLNEYIKAVSDFEILVNEYPDNAVNHQNYAWINMQVKNYEIAKKEFSIAIEMDSSLINSYLNLGWIYIQENKVLQAEKILKEGQFSDPENPQFSFFLGETYRIKGDKQRACYYFGSSAQKGSKEAKEAIIKYCK